MRGLRVAMHALWEQRDQPNALKPCPSFQTLMDYSSGIRINLVRYYTTRGMNMKALFRERQIVCCFESGMLLV